MQPAKRANSALLMGLFQIAILNKTADEACNAFQHVDAFIPFVDASFHASAFELYIEDVLKGFERALKLGWFDMSTFNINEYDIYSSLENGGFNWLIPNKALAFVCPASERSARYPAFTPELYSSLFKKLNVTDVVRLNNKTYEADRFTRQGLKHWDLYFLDGSVPHENIVQDFISITEKATGAVAVHCKAGLGRTATLIGCYAIKYFGFTGLEFIGWARLCRPGSVLGPQQQFLCDRYNNANGIVSKNLVSDEEKLKAKFGDYGQSNRLINRNTHGTASAKKIVKNPFTMSKISSFKDFIKKK